MCFFCVFRAFFFRFLSIACQVLILFRNFVVFMRILVIVIMFAFALAMQGQEKKKADVPTPVKTLLRDARASIKDKRDQAKNESNLQKALSRTDLTMEERAEIRYTQSLLNLSMNDAENVKAYLKQKYDTASFFNTLLKASQYALMCDSADIAPNEKGKVKPRFREKNRAVLLTYRPNIYAGGRFYLRKNDFKAALPFFRLYIDMLDEPLLKDNVSLLGDTILKRSYFYATLAAYNNKMPEVALKYIDSAIEGNEQERRPSLQEYKVRCYLALGDSVNWLDALYDGCEYYPQHDYFFTNLVENFVEKKQYDYGLELADTMLSRVQDIPLYWYAKSLMYLHKEDWTKCVEMSDSTLRRDSVHVNALRNKGVSLLNQAMEYAENASYDKKSAKSRRDRRVIQEMFQRALVPFERLRGMAPDKSSLWAAPLYRIYLNLNMGKEFEEIEGILRKDTSSP